MMAGDIAPLLIELKALRRKADGDVYNPDIVAIARRIGSSHERALTLWDTGYDAARELAIHIAEIDKFTSKHAESWVRDLDEWGLCDGFTARIIRHRPYVEKKAHEWAQREELYQRRAGFSLMAQMAWQKNAFTDKVFTDFLPFVIQYAEDDRLHVKKAVNWALRDIGKRNPALGKKALAVALRLKKSDNKTARWIGTHRIGEIENAHTGD